MSKNDLEVIESKSLTREEQDRIDRAVPQMLQQIDPKVLIQFLKAGGANAQVNVITIGNYYEGNGGKERDTQLQSKNEQFKERLEQTHNSDLMEWLEGLPQPRHDYLIREIMIALKKIFSSQQEAAEFIGVSPRVFSYWMKTYRIPGYKPNPRKKKEK